MAIPDIAGGEAGSKGRSTVELGEEYIQSGNSRSHFEIESGR